MDEELVFIHLPRSGGITVRESICNPNQIPTTEHRLSYPQLVVGWGYDYGMDNINKEISAVSVLDQFVIDPTKTYFTVVRNPFDQLYSYFSQCGKDEDKSKGWGNCRNIHNAHDFSSFVDIYLHPNIPFHFPHHKYNLWASAYDREGNYLPKYTLRFESLESDMKKFCETFDLAYEKHENDNKSKKELYYKLAYRPDQVKKLEKLWFKYLVQFNYSF